ncbi:hypothetical protein [Paraflavitalea pollutisoli]|uniref:hypothetical protein n=1 Tax=Paraflavitalea pollutisoli TaxID=3034143 RepID=UPI0023ED5334|nr:hypothetical protein [Paraflavitalea sp. H1-2-19X]
MRRSFLLGVGLLLAGWLPAQQFGGHPTRTRWSQINTDTIRVVFPQGYREQAAVIAGMAHRIGLETTKTLGQDYRKISIVLQPHTTISNGYVGLGPWRSEFYLTPPQNSFDLGSLTWHRTLALHEYRHIQQYNNFRKGVSKAFYYLFGEQGLELVNSAAVPNYFWEGDAVFQETSLSDQGRGRLPAFYNGYRSLWSAHKGYSWMKLRNGSLRDFVPDHYKLGYMFVAYGRQQYGADVWGKITDDAVRYKGLFYPWQHAIKKYTGKDYKSFRREALQYWETALAADGKNDSTVDGWAQQRRHFVANEEYPQWVDDQTLIYVRSSYQRVPAFYQRNVIGGQEDKLRLKDISLDNYFSYRNGKIVYAGYEVDNRWRWYDYSVIKWYDVQARKHRTLTHKTHYFSPDISEDGNRIVAVEVIPGQPSSLQLLNAIDGAVMKKLPNPEGLLYTYPKFYGSNQVVAAVRNQEGAMSLCLVNTADGRTDYLLPFSMNVIGFPTVHKDTISFSASLNGQDRLFIIANKQIQLFTPPVATAATGHYQLQVAHGRFAWSAFTAVGDKLEQGAFTPAQLTTVPAESFAQALPVYGIKEIGGTPQHGEDALPADSLYAATKYPKGFRLFNFHSWRPIVEDPDYTLSVIGENVLNTLQSEVFFNYNRNYKHKQLGASFTYSGLYPWLRLSSTYTFDRLGAYKNQQFQYNTWENALGVLIPWQFTSGRYNRSLTIGTDLIHSARIYPQQLKDSIYNPAVAYVRPYITFSNQLLTARRHIFPHFAQSVTLQYKYAVTKLDAQQFEANANWYFPGILPDHSIIVNTAFHGRDTMYAGSIFGTSFPFSRGYPAQNAHRMSKIGFNYHFALLYPDWGMANIIYFTRVRTNLFYDITRISDYSPTNTGGRAKFSVDLRSYGAEMYFDTKWWNQHNVTFGFRYSRLQDADQFRVPPPVNKWEFIVPINLLGR